MPWPVYSEDIVTSQRHNAGAEMGSPSYRLAAAITIPSTDEFLLVRQPPPPSPAPAPEEEEYLYRGYVDSELYDLPSAPLRPLAGELRSDVAIRGADSVAGRLDISRLDVSASLDQTMDFSLDLRSIRFAEWNLRGVEAPEVCGGSGVWPRCWAQHGAHHRFIGVKTGGVARLLEVDVQGMCFGIALWSKVRWYSHRALCVYWTSEARAAIKLDSCPCIALPGVPSWNNTCADEE